MRKIQSVEAVIIITVILLVAVPGIVSAQWIPDGVPVCTEDYEQHRLDIISDASGGAIIVWQDLRNDDGDIYAQRLNASGIALWTAGGVEVCTETGAQERPQITSDGAGGTIITWHDRRNDNNDIFAQRLNASGSPLWIANGVAICIKSMSQKFPKITSDGAGGAIIAWLDVYDIYAQRINADGLIHSGWAIDGEAICTADGEQYEHQIASDGSGGAIIVWRDERFSTLAFDIYAQRINSSGAVEWTYDGEVICYSSYDSQIIPDGAGGAIITFIKQWTPAGYIEINVQRINASGIFQWPDEGTYACGTEITDQPNFQMDPQITSDGAGGAIITWRDRRTGNDNDIYAQRVNSSGATMWTDDGVGICIYADEQLVPQIAADGAGGAFITWIDSRNGNDDIYAQRVDADGSINADWPLNGFGICTYTGAQSGHQIISDGSGEAIIAWEDFRATSTDIYAQKTGSLCDVAPTSLDFGTVNVGNSNELIFTITNNGSGTLTGSVSESCPHYSIVSTVPPDDPYNLANGEQVVVTVRFEPTFGGIHPCTIETGDELCSDVLCTGTGCLSGTIYVDADASGIGDGTSWLNAFTELRDALSLAHACSGVLEIWVAEGTYTPTVGTLRNATFALKNGLALYGGFAGTETLLSERDIAGNPTEVSGEIGAAGTGDNSYHVVTANNTDLTAVLDGFIVTGGNADGAGGSQPCGGGMYNLFSDPKVRNVVFKYNTSTYGGGMYNEYSNPVLINVVFSSNTATSMGGGISNSVSYPTLINITFNVNFAAVSGGGIYNYFSTATLSNTILWGNMSPVGSEIRNVGFGTATISYSLIQGCGGSGPGWDPSLGTDGGNNIDADPQFKGAYSPDSPLAVWSSSPAINAGSNAAVPVGVVIDLAGNPRIHDTIVDMGAYEHQGGTTTDVDDIPQVPDAFALYQNAPNPFNPTTTIRFDLPRAEHVKLTVYNVKGELVSTIVDQHMTAGRKEVSWTAKDNRGRAVTSGIYFYRLVAGDFVQTKKMALLK